MAKAILVFEDGDGTKEILVKVVFDPPARSETAASPAQAFAMTCLKIASCGLETQEGEDDGPQ